MGLARKVALTKLTAKNTTDSVWAADAMWRQSMRPAILYATEVIPCPSNWIKQIETAQNNVARWTIEASPSAPIAGLRGELGWPTILGEIYKRKVGYLGRLWEMNMNRWPRIVFEDLMEYNYGAFGGFNWATETEKALKELDINTDKLGSKEWKREINRKWWAYEEKVWKREKNERRSLDAYDKTELKKLAPRLKGNKASKILSRFRIGDMILLETKRKENCPACKGPIGNGVEHILRVCPMSAGMRQSEKIDEKLEECMTRTLNMSQAIKEFLKLPSIDGPLLKMHTDWKSKCVKTSKKSKATGKQQKENAPGKS